MKNKRLQPSRQKSSPPYAAMFVGAGLLVLGVVAALLLASPEQATSSTDNSSVGEDLSVIPAPVNFAAPDLTLNDLDGAQASLADFRGQVVLVNNWATWCPPCKAEMPTLQAYYEEHKDQGFLLVGIEAGEPVDEVAQFVDDYKLTFPIWLDPQNKALSAFHNQSLPSSYLIDREGVVRLAWVGAVSKSILEKYVTPMLED
jgi:cytochrome c biogenesis protein CcmG, thiol:disulfide interchange protein DsbE